MHLSKIKNNSPKYLFKYLSNDQKIYLINRHHNNTNYIHPRFLEFYTDNFKDNTAIVGYLQFDLANMKLSNQIVDNVHPYKLELYDAKLLSDSMNIPLVVYINPWCYIDYIEEVFYHKPENHKLNLTEKNRKKI